MNQIDWSKYPFHCSGLSNLMVNSRKKDEMLSETTKSYLRDVWIKEVWGREKTDMLANKFTQKGIMCETDSINLVEKVLGKAYFKNQKTLTNEFVTGTPDVINPDLVDIKTSWDLFTFASVDVDKATKDYFYQLLGYMWLTGKKVAFLTYCLVDTPDELADNELMRMFYQKVPEDQIEKYKNNYKFDDIPAEKKVKQYRFEFDESLIETLKLKIDASRQYLQTLSL